MRTALGLLLAAVVGIPASVARGEFALADSDRVIFYGGPVVEPPSFGSQVELFVRVRYPDLKTWFLHQPSGPEGTVSEALATFDERVSAFSPTVVVLAFGPPAPGPQPPDPLELQRFRAEFDQLARKTKGLGARVWVVTPPIPDASLRPQLRDIGYEETASEYAAAVREIAERVEVPVVDWHAAALEYRTEHPTNAQLRLAGPNGVDPTPVAAAVATDALLEAWQAAPMQFRIRADWGGDLADVTVGAVTVDKPDENSLVISLKDIPLPWYVANRRNTLAMYWPPARFYEYELQIENVPDVRGLGFTIGEKTDAGVQGIKPFLAMMLRDGCDVSAIGPLTTAAAVGTLQAAVDRKDRWYGDLERFREKARTVPEPELQPAYETQALAFRQYADGTAALVNRVPRTMDIDIVVQAAQPLRAQPRPAPPQPPSPPAPTAQPAGDAPGSDPAAVETPDAP
jgi:hypothetical protein